MSQVSPRVCHGVKDLATCHEHCDTAPRNSRVPPLRCYCCDTVSTFTDSAGSLLSPQARDYIFRLMHEQGLTQRELAERVGISESHVSKMLSLRRGVSLERLRDFARVLGVTAGQIMLGGESYRPELLEEPPRRAPQAISTEPLPVYRYAAAGDPIDPDPEGRPTPVTFATPPLDKLALVGPRGFGVLVRGTSMTKRNIRPGDVVWVNPDMRPLRDWPVVAYVHDCMTSNGAREDGVVVKVYAQRAESGGYGLLSDGDEGRAWLDCREVRYLGRVVGKSVLWDSLE